MADGLTKPIEKVEVGDKVVATDPRTGKASVQTATAKILGKGQKDLVHITLTAHDGSSANTKTKVTATVGHPFLGSDTAGVGRRGPPQARPMAPDVLGYLGPDRRGRGMDGTGRRIQPDGHAGAYLL
ncbi:polymorphic toxin-type HINT domain-containing protein [Streptomyces sp. NPDC004673]